MRFSLVILACLATAFAADLEETTSASNSNIENGNDLSPTLFDEESGTNTFEDSESSREGQGIELLDENKDKEETSIEEEPESETEAFENSETVDEDEGVGVRDEGDDNGDNEEIATQKESEPESSEMVDEGVDVAGEDENEMATEEESETETFENSETVDEDGGVDIVGEDENEGNNEMVTEEKPETEDEINQSNGEDEVAEDEGLPSNQEGDEDIPTQPETPVFNDITDAPAPTEVEVPTSDFAPTPTYAPRTPFPSIYNSPSLRPAVPYVSATDDPLEDEYDADGDGYDDRFDWFAKDSETIEELEHDKTVIIALSVTFGVMFFFSIFVAFQMLENPDGCCARLVFFQC